MRCPICEEREGAYCRECSDDVLTKAHQGVWREWEAKTSLLAIVKTMYESPWPASCPPQWCDAMREAISKAEGRVQ